MYPLALKPASKQLRLTPMHQSNETNGYGTNLLLVWGASSHERSPGAVKQSRMEFK